MLASTGLVEIVMGDLPGLKMVCDAFGGLLRQKLSTKFGEG